MSSDKKNLADQAAERETVPIKPEEVKVTVTPRETQVPKKAGVARKSEIEQKNTDNANHAKKATGDDSSGATKEIRDAIKKAAPAGREAQKKAADQATEDLGKKLQQSVYKDVQTDILGEAPIVKPATEGPPPAAPTPPQRKKS